MKKRNLEKELNRNAERILPGASLKERVTKAVDRQMQIRKAEQMSASPRRFSKRMVMGFVATCLVACIGLGVGLGIGLKPTPTANPVLGDDISITTAPTYVSVDINPSFGIEVDEDGVVVSVTALNEDAVIVLVDVNLVGMHIEDAVATIINLASELGYLVDEGIVSVITSNEDGELQDKVSGFIENALNDINQGLGDKNITINIEKGKEHILDAMEEMGKIIDGMEDMTAEELHKHFKDYNKEKLDKFRDEVEAERERIHDQLKEEYEAKKQQLLEEYENFKPIIDKIKLASEEKDYVSLALAIEEAIEYITALSESQSDNFLAMFLASKDIDFDGDFMTIFVTNPEMFNEYYNYISEFLSEDHGKDMEELLKEKVREHLKDKKDEGGFEHSDEHPAGHPDGQPDGHDGAPGGDQ